MKVFTILFSGLLFASCMHMGMPMMEGGHEGHPGDPLLEKEVTVGDIKAVATFPPMVVGEEQVFTLKLSSTASRTPVTGAEVYFHATSAQEQSSTGQDVSHHHAEGGHDSNVTRNVGERSGDPGTYAVSYTPSAAGSVDLTFHVASVGNEKLDRAIVIEAQRAITDPSKMTHGGMMMGSGHSTSTYWIIGGALMAAMMVFMLIRR